MLEIKKIQKRSRNSDCDLIVVKKNFRVIDTLAIIYYKFSCSFGNQTKVIFFNSIHISFWCKYIIFPSWFNQFIFPIINSRFTHYASLLKTHSLNRLVFVSSLNDKKLVTNRYHTFYKNKLFIRMWLHYFYVKSKKNLNVCLYKKKV